MADVLELVALALTTLVAVAGAFGFIWREFKSLEERLRELERRFQYLEPVAEHMHEKLQETARHMGESA